MELKYMNFDGLDISFHGQIDSETLDVLQAAKSTAIETRRDAPAVIGGVPVMVKEAGRRGGFAYVFTTGEDGETWAVMGRNEPSGRWMISASVNSAAFAQYGGLEAIRDRLRDRLDAFGYTATKCPASGYREAVARVDFCMDFRADDFVLDPQALASKGKKSGYLEGATAHWGGRRVTGCTVGKLPNSQVVFYDKTLDIAAKEKGYWWDVWGLKNDSGATVWRLELRAGKRYLKEQWGIRTMDDLMASVGDLFAATLRRVRLVELTDSNITRCPDAPLWKRAKAAVAKGLGDMVSGLLPGTVKATTRERFDAQMLALLKGVAMTHAAVMVGRPDLPAIFDHIRSAADQVIQDIQRDREEAVQKLREAKARYHLLELETWKRRQTHMTASPWLSAPPISGIGLSN